MRLDQERRADEVDKDAKRQASQIVAWVVVVNPEKEDARTAYGVLLQNNSGAIVHDVSVQVKLFGEQVQRPATTFVLPPGQFFIERITGPNAKYDWGFVKSVDELAGSVVRPYVNTDKHRVLGLTYGDSLRQRWSQDQYGRLTAVTAPNAESG